MSLLRRGWEESSAVLDMSLLEVLSSGADVGLLGGGWLGFLLLQLGMGCTRSGSMVSGSLWSFPLKQLVYRQQMYLVVIQSVWTSLAGSPRP